jgi:hypothetical protein
MKGEGAVSEQVEDGGGEVRNDALQSTGRLERDVKIGGYSDEDDEMRSTRMSGGGRLCDMSLVDEGDMFCRGCLLSSADSFTSWLVPIPASEALLSFSSVGPQRGAGGSLPAATIAFVTSPSFTVDDGTFVEASTRDAFPSFQNKARFSPGTEVSSRPLYLMSVSFKAFQAIGAKSL